MRAFGVIVFAFVSVFISAQTQVSLTVCELMKTPTAFDGRIVKVIGRVYGDMERLELGSPECSERAAIYLNPVADTYPPVDFHAVQDRNWKTFLRYRKEEFPGYCVDKDCPSSSERHEITATILGRFDFGEIKSSDGKVLRPARMGFLGEYKARVVVKEIVSVKRKKLDGMGDGGAGL